MLLLLTIIALIIALLAVIFAIQNINVILVSFLIWKIEGPLSLVLLLTFILGFIAGLLILLPRLLKRRSTILDQAEKLEEKDELKNTIQQQESDGNDKY